MYDSSIFVITFSFPFLQFLQFVLPLLLPYIYFHSMSSPTDVISRFYNKLLLIELKFLSGIKY
jgi:hypothetical protein